jgi:NAD(P)-dependent dehydrogenase (short-subunit alcohol dehydrogenase family)
MLAGIMGVPGLGPYCATKWAIEGLTESLSQELEGFGCKATIVEIGNAHRYTFIELCNCRSHDPASPNKWGHLTLKPPVINDYVGTPVEHSKRMIIWLSDRQPTHPQKVGNMIWEVEFF